MRIDINPKLYISKDKLKVLNDKGDIYEVSSEQKKRLLEIKNNPSVFEKMDLDLLEKDLIFFSENKKKYNSLFNNIISKKLSSSAGLTIMPTEKCNLRCTYCYEKFEKGKMQLDITDALSKSIDRFSSNYKIFNLSWFGGEPLMNPQAILKLGTKFRQNQKEHGFVGTIGITTNGTLLKSIKEIESIKVDAYQISIDGPQIIHDQLRKTIKGNGTYSKILENIEYILSETDSNVFFRINQDTTNEKNVKIIKNWLQDSVFPRFEKYKNKIIYNNVAIWDASTTSVDGICIRDLKEFQNWLSIKKIILKYYNEDIEDYIKDSMNKLGGLACYAGLPNHYIVGSDGLLYKCSVAFDLPANRIGKIKPDGSFEIDDKKESKWINDNYSNDANCKSCALSYSCLGLHCPLIRIQSNESPCPTEKKYIESII